MLSRRLMFRFTAALVYCCAMLSLATAPAAAAPGGSFIQFTIEGHMLKKRVATFDIPADKLRNPHMVQLSDLTSREGHRYTSLVLMVLAEPSNRSDLITLGATEDAEAGAAERGSMAMRSTPAQGVAASLTVQRAVTDKQRITGTFSGVLVVTNRKDRSPEQRTYTVSQGRYDLTRAPKP